MPTYSEIVAEIVEASSKKLEGDANPFDFVRRKYLVKLHAHTKRDIILYASKFTQTAYVPPGLTMINFEDLQGTMEVIHGLKGPNLDLIIHSPGGLLEAAEGIVNYLRSKFDHIRVIVPQLAMSAATTIACGADVIMMGKHSFLGPTDPQFNLNTSLGQRSIPAQAIREQYNLLMREFEADPTKKPLLVPMMEQFLPDLLVTCDNVTQLSKDTVKRWLQTYMLKDDNNCKSKAGSIASWLSNHKVHKTHGRLISRNQLEEIGLNIECLEDDQTAQDLFLSVFHATSLAFKATPYVKIIENHNGRQYPTIFNPEPQGSE